MSIRCGVVVRFITFLCLVGFIAAKCHPEKCGSMSVSYPFWINNSGCGHTGFQITCEKDNDTRKMAPFFYANVGNYTEGRLKGNRKDGFLYPYKIMEIDYTGHLIIDSWYIYACTCGHLSGQTYFGLPSDGSFTISSSNSFVVVGCNTSGTYSFGGLGEVRCVAICESQSTRPYCLYGCCEINLPNNWPSINFTGGGLFRIFNTTSNKYQYKCGFSTIFDPSTFSSKSSLFGGRKGDVSYGLRINWGIGLQNCTTAKNTANYSCASKAECIDSPSEKGHVCKCLPGYEGNGYMNGTDCTDIDECSGKKLNMCVGEERGGICHNLVGSYNCSCAKGYEGDGFHSGTRCTDIDECSGEKLNMCLEEERGGICHNLAGSYNCSCAKGYKGDGFHSGKSCTDIDECSGKNLNMCVGEERGGICHNLAGSYNCSCTKGYKGDGFHNGTRCMSTSSNRVVFPAIIGSVSSFVFVSLVASLFVWWLKKRNLKVVEAKYFQQLQQFIASRVGRETLRMFSAKELARASNNYSKEMELGSGGFGTVFKGIMLDGTFVAIKKSKKAFNLEDDHEFLNEIAILSQINHRNIVKLLGCCIQTKFPLLVSEFIPNGTLFQHLHSKEGSLPWASRLQIAIETGEALAYLHSGASQPIFHRDVKSSNIILDEKLSPKVADFGISRLISASNDTHLTTNIMGTRGYLDPEYFQTYHLTEKSDVYSFGVILVELLTSLQPISTARANNELNLSHLFLLRLHQKRLTEILDDKILEEGNLQQMEDMGRLARECLHMERKKRPSMKEVVEELLWIRGGTRTTKFHGSVECDDATLEQNGFFTSYEFKNYTFPSPVGSTLEDPLTSKFEMSTLSEQTDFKGKHF